MFFLVKGPIRSVSVSASPFHPPPLPSFQTGFHAWLKILTSIFVCVCVWLCLSAVVSHSNAVSVAQLNCTFILEPCCYQGWLHCKGYSCNEGRLMGAGTNWHCALIGGFPKYIPVRQQTKSKIANCTGLGCFKSLALYSWSCCALLLQHTVSVAITRWDLKGNSHWATP